MQDALGFSLPGSGLRDWLRARPAPGTPARVARDAQSRPETIEQNGWTVHYVAWTDDGNNTDGAMVVAIGPAADYMQEETELGRRGAITQLDGGGRHGEARRYWSSTSRTESGPLVPGGRSRSSRRRPTLAPSVLLPSSVQAT